MKDLELMLLNMWKSNDFEVIYKYKNRIKAFREPLVNIELFYDPTYGMFQDVEDIANYEDSTPEDFKRKIDDLIQARVEIPKECTQLILSILNKYKADEPLTPSTKDSIETVERWFRLIMPKEN